MYSIAKRENASAVVALTIAGTIKLSTKLPASFAEIPIVTQEEKITRVDERTGEIMDQIAFVKFISVTLSSDLASTTLLVKKNENGISWNSASGLSPAEAALFANMLSRIAHA